MSVNAKNTDDEIRAFLHRGDPAGDGGTLAPDEVARLRRRVLAAVPSESSRRWRPGWALGLSVAAAAVMVSIVVFLWTPSAPLRTDRSPVGSPTPDTAIAREPGRDPSGAGKIQPAATSPEPGIRTPRRAVRQLQFVTPGGTRVIWTLDPEFDV